MLDIVCSLDGAACVAQTSSMGADALEDQFARRWRNAIGRLEAIDRAADHRCFHTSDVLSPDAMRRAHEIARAAPLSPGMIDKIRPLFTLSQQQEAERDRLLPLAEAVRVLGCDLPTILALIKAGELIAERDSGRAWVVPNWAIRAYRDSTNKTFCVDCRGSVDGKLESRWLEPVRRRRSAGATTS